MMTESDESSSSSESTSSSDDDGSSISRSASSETSGDSESGSGSEESYSDSEDSDDDSSSSSSSIPPPPPPPPPPKPKKRRALYSGAREAPEEPVQIIVEAPVVVSQEKIEKSLRKAENRDYILSKIEEELEEKRNTEIKAKILEAEQLERDRAVKARQEAEQAAREILDSLGNAATTNENDEIRRVYAESKAMYKQQQAATKPAAPVARGIQKYYAQEGDEKEGDVRVDRSLLMELFDEEKEAMLQRKEVRRRRKEEERRLRQEIKQKKKLMKKIQKKIRKKKKEERRRKKLRMLKEGECSNAVVIMEKVRRELGDPDLEKKLKKIAQRKRDNKLKDKDRKQLMCISKIEPTATSRPGHIKFYRRHDDHHRQQQD